MAGKRVELGTFLRARRDRLTPARAGIEAFPGARRVPGLRRDELAYLAGISPDYYSRVEQGRQERISDEVLESLARALRLDQVEAAHLRRLAAPTPARRAATRRPQRPDPGLLRIMDSLGHLPVLLLGDRGEVLAVNGLLRELLGEQLRPGSSFPRYLLLDPLARERIVNWETFARASVGALRHELARHPDDARLRGLIEELRAADEDVGRWWADHGVRDYASVPKQIRHPTVGDLRFDIEVVTAPNEPDQRLVAYTTEPDSPTARMLPLLSVWSGTPGNDVRQEV